MDLARLRHFYIIVQEGSLSGAGKVLKMDHSTLSRSMELLEHSLKTQLLHRSARGVKLTPQGERVFKFASRFMKEREQFLQEFHNLSNTPQGELIIATTPGTAIFLLNFIDEFMQIYPDIKINLHGVYDNINLDHADVIVRPFMPNHRDLMQEFLLEYTIGLFASQKYIDRYGQPSTIEELKDHKLIGYNDKRLWQYAQFYWVNKRKGEKFWETEGLSVQVSSAELAISAAEQGLGIAELAREFKNIRSPHLIELFPDMEHPVGELHYIYKKEYAKSKKVTAFCEFLKIKLSKN